MAEVKENGGGPDDRTKEAGKRQKKKPVTIFNEVEGNALFLIGWEQWARIGNKKRENTGKGKAEAG